MTGTDIIDFANPASLRQASLRRYKPASTSLSTLSTPRTQLDSKSTCSDRAEISKPMPRFTHASNADICRVGKGLFTLFTNDSRLGTNHGREHRRKLEKITTALNEDKDKPNFPPFNQAVSEAVDCYNESLFRGSTAINVVTTYKDQHDDIDTEWHALVQITESESFLKSQWRRLTSASPPRRYESKTGYSKA